MSPDVRDAIAILCDSWQRVRHDGHLRAVERNLALLCLLNAIRHISRPERDTYPKTRKGTKSVPITLRRQS